jgi:hypothetical protein
MPNAVIFDVDGTLIDSNHLHTECWLETFEHFGLDFAYDQVRGQIGKGGDQLLPALLSADMLEQQREAISSFRDDLFKRTLIKQRYAKGKKVAFPCRTIPSHWTADFELAHELRIVGTTKGIHISVCHQEQLQHSLPNLVAVLCAHTFFLHSGSPRSSLHLHKMRNGKQLTL